MSDELSLALVRDERNRAWSALYQIKKAMPMLRDLLESMPMGTVDIGGSSTGEANWSIGGMSKSIQLSALVGATLEVIATGLPEDYKEDEKDTSHIRPVPDTPRIITGE